MKYMDIHSHLLPGIDDGARDFKISMEMFRIAEKNGIGAMILTPHYKPMHHNASPATIRRLISEIEEKLKEEKIEIQLYPGNEIYYHSEAVSQALEGRLCTMAGSSYVLVEFNPMDEFEYIRNGLYQFLAEGFRPVLAHVERYRCMTGKADRAEELTGMGAYIQVNAGSIMGCYGLQIKMFTRGLLKRKAVHFVATDAHDTKNRAPELSECARFLVKKFGEDYTRELLYENPMKLVQNEYI
ncbi:protein-tyrosine-phosphatase [Suilimivivens aceti]|uniref:protein-tyrosine-phosphatase n=1 Tax=Suilimivivens aceti TaxID=2981774 RepID=A0ABT2T5Y2_9FIRM|nr:CpsB/CapC family capsule biosynthesis tyrosine phosphatase [Suilimivivens aceti]MCU6745660.1 protein-tyrosine-phosphatase [Suilimivivens aceti]SCI29007.1 Tyrosine-protein phosphatase YwqE [uncultured Clostridium sp.]